jgi:hypothetical protein
MRFRGTWPSLAIPFALSALVTMAPLHSAHALKVPVQLGELEEADRKALETIAGHDEKLRDSVLAASLHVDALVETQRIQEQSSASFQERIGNLDKKQQEQMWEIVREPGLLDELATENRPSRSELDAIAARHPESLRTAIRTFGSERHDLLVDVAQIHRRASDRFDAAVSDLDAETQQAFRDLVDQPELLTVLVHRVNLVVRLGDSYRKNPRDTRSYLASLAKDVEARKAADQEEWKERIENDPKAAAELDEAARAYSEEQGYDYDELTRSEVRTSVNLAVYPYPYWFGYPAWYADAYLYPYGYWYPYPVYFGYYHHHGHYAWYGLPSLPFMHWFYYGNHHHHYSHLSHCFNGHYYGRRYASTYYNTTVSNFIRRSDATHRGRGDDFGRGGRSVAGREASNASYSGRDRGFFFNRHRAEEATARLGRRAPGERGAVLDPSRSGGDRGRGRGGDAATARGRDRGIEQSSRAKEQPRMIQQRSNARERTPAATPSRRQERAWPHAPRVVRGEPTVDQAPASRGERSGGERRGEVRRNSGGDDSRAYRGGGSGGQSTREAPSPRGGDRGQGRSFRGSEGGSRGQGGSVSRGSGWSGGGSRGGHFGGGGGSRGGSFGGGGRGR